MKKTPAALKWLAEKRARVAGELESAKQVKEIFEPEVQELKNRLADSETLLAASVERVERLTLDLSALDKTVTIYDAGLRPEAIEPIHAWQGNYGKRGALREFILNTLKQRAPAFIDTHTLSYMTIAEFSLVFIHARACQWPSS